MLFLRCNRRTCLHGVLRVLRLRYVATLFNLVILLCPRVSARGLPIRAFSRRCLGLWVLLLLRLTLGLGLLVSWTPPAIEMSAPRSCVMHRSEHLHTGHRLFHSSCQATNLFDLARWDDGISSSRKLASLHQTKKSRACTCRGTADVIGSRLVYLSSPAQRIRYSCYLTTLTISSIIFVWMI